MLQIDLLGTGGMVPLPGRYLTALLVRYQGEAILVDCGEGTQMAIRSAGLGFKQIGTICLTHFHADHVAGLPGLLLTVGNSGRTEPMGIIGPRHVGQLVDCLRVIAPQLPYPIHYIETDGEDAVFTMDALTISTHRVPHWIPCYAYRFDLHRQGRFDAERAKALQIPVCQWSVLQAGESVEVGGRSIKPAEVLGPPRKGLRVCYSTDLRPADSLAEFVGPADLFICEGMYGAPELQQKAVEHRHCMFQEAASMAKQAGARELWLTHFSPSMPNPEEYLHHATAIFPHTSVNQTNKTLLFED